MPVVLGKAGYIDFDGIPIWLINNPNHCLYPQVAKAFVGKKSDNPTYAVHVVAEGLGEINPYALMCEEAYATGESS